MVVEIFKTNITSTGIADNIINLLLQHFPDSKINFDLEDCDNILRIETKTLQVQKVEELVVKQGYYCKAFD